MNRFWDRVSFILFFLGIALTMIGIGIYLKVLTEYKEDNSLWSSVALGGFIMTIVAYLFSPKDELDLKGSHFSSWWLK